MTRLDEYRALRARLEETPPALESAVPRAAARAKRRRALGLLLRPAACLCGLALAFTAAVNASPAVAYALSGVPGMDELVKLVLFDPSLKAAVEHDHIQYVGRTEDAGGVPVTVESMVADPRNLVVFYRAPLPEGVRVAQVDPLTESGEPLPAALSYGEPDAAGDGLRKLDIQLMGGDAVPARLRLRIRLEGDGGFAAQAEFLLEPSPALLRAERVVEIGRRVELDGQAVLLERLEIYPAQARLILRGGEGNTAALHGLDVWLEDGAGNRWEQRSSGIVATAEPGSGSLNAVWLESSYFAGPAGLTLHLAGAAFQRPEERYGELDPARGTATNLPEGVRVERLTPRGRALEVVLSGVQEQPNHFYAIAGGHYLTPGGEEVMIGSSSVRADEEHPGRFLETFTIPDYREGTRLVWGYVPMKRLAEPVVIPLDGE